jgi:uncharacterized protein
MPQDDFNHIKSNVLRDLGGLNPHLTYHNIDHTLDVVEQSERIARVEGIHAERDLFLLKVAALYHDTGFLHTYVGHELKSCEKFMQECGGTELSDYEKGIICGLIMATRIPQEPLTLMEQIICDADLDYLGRDDFFSTGAKLKEEFLYYKVVANDPDWDRLQLNFLKNHTYHTEASRRQREPKKQENYLKLL